VNWSPEEVGPRDLRSGVGPRLGITKEAGEKHADALESLYDSTQHCGPAEARAATDGFVERGKK
jgi:hypothetical protein